MKKVRVAVARGFAGTFNKWEMRPNGKVRLFRTSLAMPKKFGYPEAAYKDFNPKDVGFIEIWIYNKVEKAVIKWLKKVIQWVQNIFAKSK